MLLLLLLLPPDAAGSDLAASQHCDTQQGPTALHVAFQFAMSCCLVLLHFWSQRSTCQLPGRPSKLVLNTAIAEHPLA